MWCKISIILLLALVNDGLALKILAIIGSQLKTHYNAFEPLFRELARRGHSVTVITNFPDDKPSQNLRFIDLQQGNFQFFPNLTQYVDNYFARYQEYLVHWRVITGFTKDNCETLLTNGNAKAHLAAKIKYDVIFIEQFWISDCELLYAATFFDAPIIGITSHVLLPGSYPRLGIPFDVASDPHYVSNAGPNPPLFYKIEAFLANLYFNTIGRWQPQLGAYETFQKHGYNVDLDIERIARERMKMMFVYQHYSVTGARLLAPRVLEIGGAHISPLKPLPMDIEDFLSSAKHGAIYVSFGSNLKASTMSQQKLGQFLAAFKSVPQKVLWKWEGGALPKGHENILAKKWFPQLDVLCHPKVLAFVSHGGMLSISEAAHCGKPVVAVPFFGDQYSNAAAVRASGLGRSLYFQDITAETLAEAIKELTSAEMQQSAKRVSSLWHDRPLPVLDSAVYWTEYVARHHGAPPALPSTHNTWFESTLADVYTVLFAIIFLLYWIGYLTYKLIRLVICRVICRSMCRRKEKSQ